MEAEHRDYMIRATAADGMIRAFAATTRDMTERARAIHNLSPIAAAALGRLMTAAVMMGSDMKGEDDLLTLKINCDGPIGGLLATADKDGNVKGYVNCPDVMLPANELGKLDVGGAVGNGVLSVIKDIGLKEPYVGQTLLQTGEIAEDLTYYYAVSEQIPSSVALGVLMNRENTVRQAGGFLIQLMPGVTEEVTEKIEEQLKSVHSISSMLDGGLTPEDILGYVLRGLNPMMNGRLDVQFRCSCSKERFAKGLISIGRKDLQEMIDEGKEIETVCHFCGSKYTFSVEELKKLLEEAK